MTEGVESETGPSPSPPPELEVYETSAAWLVVIVGAVVALGYFAGWSLVVTILGVIVMITLHELGHFLTAKWAGMKVTEFFIGFGPRLWSFRRGETEYGIKPIPAGAYVRIIGMNNLDEVPSEDEPRAYREQSFPKRLIVVLAGPATHFIQAVVLVFLLLAVTGVPGGSITTDLEHSENWAVTEVTRGSAAAHADLESGDRVVAFDGKPVETFGDLTKQIRRAKVGDEVTLTVERAGERFETTTEIGGRPENQSGPGAPPNSPFLGVGHDVPDKKLGVVDAVREAPIQTVEITGAAISALGRFFSPSGLGNFADTVREGSDESSEPAASSSSGSSNRDEGDDGRLISIIGAVRIGAALGEESMAGLLLFFLSINIFVGLLNLVPLLPFDGGHAAVAIYERVRSKQGQRYYADVTKLLPVAYAVVMVLVVLGVTTMYLDLVNPLEL